VKVYHYTEMYRLSVIASDTIKRSDSVLIQGVGTAGDHSFAARRVTRLAKTVPFGPGIRLAPETMAAPALAASDMPVATEPAAPAVTETSPASAEGADLKKGKAKREAKAEKEIQNAVRRGLLTGQVVSANPLRVELVDGQLRSVTQGPGTVVLSQVRIPVSSLQEGDRVLVRGSEVSSGVLRAAEVNVLPEGVSLAEARGARGNRAKK
jgi:hypothetical protein